MLGKPTQSKVNAKEDNIILILSAFPVDFLCQSKYAVKCYFFFKELQKSREYSPECWTPPFTTSQAISMRGWT